MPARVFNAFPLLISTAVAAWIGLHVARRIHKAGVEHYAGRLLILAAITNTTSVILMLLLLGVMSLCGLMTPAGFRGVDLVVVLLFLFLPVRAGWNYIKASARITRRLGLLPLRTDEPQREVSAVAKAMGVATPVILSSPQCRIPFVFGRASRQARLALPDTWSAIDANSRHIMLCHELAHIRNRDVGVLTWSFAFLHDLKWALLLSPVVIALSLWGGQEHLPQAALLYVACLLILGILTNIVVRSREFLADATVAMLIEPGRMARTFEEILLAPETGLRPAVTNSRGLISQVRSWLTDKAMFSRHPRIWKTMTRFAEFSLDPHPSVHARRQAIHGGRTARLNACVRDGQAFWAGLTLGLLAVLVALGGFWAGRFILGWEDDEQIVLLSYDCWGSTAPLAATCVALFFVLPTWASLHPHVPTGQNVVSFLVRYLYGLLGAGCVLPLILLGGWSHLEIKLLLVLAILWVLVVLAMGFVTNLVMLSLWLSFRYRRRSFFINLAGTLYSCSLGLLAISCYFAWGLVLLSGGRTLAGGSVIFGLLVGLAACYTISKDSVVSGTDQYLVVAPPFVLIALEGRTYRRWSPLTGSLHMMGACLAPAAVVSVTSYEVGAWALGHLADPTAAVLLLVLGLACSILLFLDWRWPRRMRQVCRQKIGALVGSQILLQRAPSLASGRVLDKALGNLRVQYDKRGSFGVMTTQKMFELMLMASLGGQSGGWIGERAHQWALACETGAGFGVWPGSGPRLSATYQCLQLLQETGGIRLSDPHRHVTWIRSLQMQDGSFRGPWSYRSPWEDTFYAVAALRLLGSSLDNEARDRCLAWVRRTLIRTGLEKGQVDAFHHCLAAVEALQGLDEEIMQTASQWLSTELDRLLLTHVAHNAENVHHAVCAYQILKKRGLSLMSPERVALLADRVRDALEAELAALRI